MIGLEYEEASQAGQGALSHRIRLDEIEQSLAEKTGLLTQLETKTTELRTQVQAVDEQLKADQQLLKKKFKRRSRLI